MIKAMFRTGGWRARLHDAMGEARTKTHEPGTFDCALLAADGVLALTGHDYAAKWRGQYTTYAGGLKLLKQDGFDDHVDFWSRIYEEIHPAKAAVGDLAVFEFDGEAVRAMGVVIGERVQVLHPSGDRLGTVDFLTATKAFRIP